MKILEALSALHPRVFENLVYDLLVKRGLGNVTWRTPGADGGRDLEGLRPVIDFSGTSRLERWYVECKRYQQSIDWPTVFAKLAFAENHGADFLLFCTTSTLSPRCRDELATRDAINRRPIVRAWEGHDLSGFIGADPLLMAKYGLSGSASEAETAVLPVLWGATKSIQDAYGHSLGLRGQSDSSLELAASLSELAVVSVDRFGSLKVSPRRFRVDQDSYAWCTVTDSASLDQFDAYGLRAALCAIRLFGRRETLQIGPPDSTMSKQNTVEIRIWPPPWPCRPSFITIMNTICVTCNFEWSCQERALVLVQRNHSDEREPS